MGAREKNLRAALLAAHIVDIGAHAIPRLQRLTRQHFIAPDDGFGAAQINDHIAVFHALDEAVDDLADAVLELVILPVAFGLAHLLDDDLLCRLGSDATEIHRRQGFGNEITRLGGRIAALGIFKDDLGCIIVDGLDDFQQAGEMNLTRLGIDLGAHIGLQTVARAGRLLDGVFHRGENDFLVDGLLAGDRVGNLQQFQTIGANGHGAYSSCQTFCLVMSCPQARVDDPCLCRRPQAMAARCDAGFP